MQADNDSGSGSGSAQESGHTQGGGGGIVVDSTDGFRAAMERWVWLDAQIGKHNQALRAAREQRTAVMRPLVRYMEGAGMQKTRIKTASDGVVSYALENIQQSFTQAFVADGLTAFFVERHGEQAGRGAAADCMAYLKARRVPAQQAVLRRAPPT